MIWSSASWAIAAPPAPSRTSVLSSPLSLSLSSVRNLSQGFSLFSRKPKIDFSFIVFASKSVWSLKYPYFGRHRSALFHPMESGICLRLQDLVVFWHLANRVFFFFFFYAFCFYLFKIMWCNCSDREGYYRLCTMLPCVSLHGFSFVLFLMIWKSIFCWLKKKKTKALFHPNC